MKSFHARIALTSLLGLAAVLPARAADKAPTVDSILDRFVEASGGKAAMEKIKSRTVRGEIDILGSTADWVMHSKAPNKQLSEVESPTIGTAIDGFDGVVAWSKNAGGIRVKEGEELAKTRRDADFHRNLHLKTLYPDLAYKGTEKFDGEDVHVLESKPSASSKERFSFSARSGLLIRQESEFETPQGKFSGLVRIDDYRAVDGIKFPHSLKFRMDAGGQEFEFAIRVKELKHNVTIEDAKFTRPNS